MTLNNEGRTFRSISNKKKNIPDCKISLASLLDILIYSWLDPLIH